MNELVLTSLLVALVFAGISAAVGGRKGMAVSGAVAGLTLGPLGLIWIAVQKGNRRQCPACREDIDRLATVCSHCRTPVEPLTGPAGEGLGKPLPRWVGITVFVIFVVVPAVYFASAFAFAMVR
jgi:hypothetical protein